MSQGVRVLLVTQYFWPENFRINDVVGGLVRRGFQVTVLTGLPNYPSGKIFDTYKADPREYGHFQGADIVRIPIVPRGDRNFTLFLNYLTFALSASVVGIFKLRRREFDAILCYEPSPITVGFPAVVLRFIKRAPLIFWVQDLWPDTLRSVGVLRSRVALAAVSVIVRFIYKRCDLILAQSKEFIPQIKLHAPPTLRVLYFPNWADQFPELGVVEAAPEVPISPRRFNVVFAGNIGEAQDFPAILSAAEQLRDCAHIRWLIVGDGRLAGWVASEIRRRGLQGCVELLGRFPANRMPSFFKHADALLVSLKNDPIFSLTIPSKIQTYLSVGLPIIAMLDGAGADVVRESGAGLACRAGDYMGLASAVLEVSRMTLDERREFGRSGRAFSRREYSRDSLLDVLAALIRELVRSKA